MDGLIENKWWRLDYFIINKEFTDSIIMSYIKGSDYFLIEWEVNLRKLW